MGIQRTDTAENSENRIGAGSGRHILRYALSGLVALGIMYATLVLFGVAGQASGAEGASGQDGLLQAPVAEVKLNGAVYGTYNTLGEAMAVINGAGHLTSPAELNLLSDITVAEAEPINLTVRRAPLLISSQANAMHNNGGKPFVIKRTVATPLLLTGSDLAGAVTLQNVVLDGGGMESDKPLVTVSQPVELGTGAVLQNAVSHNFPAGQSASSAVVISGNTFTLRGGTIKNCTSSDRGGAVSFASGAHDPEFYMDSGEITGCSAALGGGAVFANGKTTLWGGRIHHNTYDSPGAQGGSAILVSRLFGSDTIRYVQQGTKVDANTSVGNGAAVVVDDAHDDGEGEIFFEDGAVSNNANAGGRAAGIQFSRITSLDGWGGIDASISPDFFCVGNKMGGTVSGDFASGGAEANFATSDAEKVKMSISEGMGLVVEGKIGYSTNWERKPEQPGADITYAENAGDAVFDRYEERFEAGDPIIYSDLDPTLGARPVYTTGKNWKLVWATLPNIHVVSAGGLIDKKVSGLSEAVSLANTSTGDVSIELLQNVNTDADAYSIKNAHGKMTTVTTSKNFSGPGRAQIKQAQPFIDDMNAGLFTCTTSLTFKGVDLIGSSVPGGSAFYVGGGSDTQIILGETDIKSVRIDAPVGGFARAVLALDMGAKAVIGEGASISGSTYQEGNIPAGIHVLGLYGPETGAEITGNAVITGNTVRGGVVALNGDGASLKMTGGTISQNSCLTKSTAEKTAGIITMRAADAKAELLGGTITGNTLLSAAQGTVVLPQSVTADNAQEVALGGPFNMAGNTVQESGAEAGLGSAPKMVFSLAGPVSGEGPVGIQGFATGTPADDPVHLAEGKLMFTAPSEAAAKQSERLADGSYRFVMRAAKLYGEAREYQPGKWGIVWVQGKGLIQIAQSIDSPLTQDETFLVKITQTATGHTGFATVRVPAGATEEVLTMEVESGEYQIENVGPKTAWRYTLAGPVSVATPVGNEPPAKAALAAKLSNEQWLSARFYSFDTLDK